MIGNIYKPGQGYWTRMVSGIAAGVFVVAGGVWLWEKLSVLSTEHRVYFQGAALVLVIAALSPLVYKWVAVKPRSCDFLIATEAEMKKVNWPAFREVKGSTWVVVGSIVFLFLLLFFSDVAFLFLGRLIGIQE